MTTFDTKATTRERDDPAFAPESTPWNFVPMRHVAVRRCREDTGDPRAPYPESAIEAFRDLGLSDDEIARYFATRPNCIERLSDSGQGAGRSRNLRHFAQQMRAKLLGGIFG